MKTVNATFDAINALVNAEFVAVSEFDAAAIERDSVLASLVSCIDYEPGKPATSDAVAEYDAIRSAYVAAWCAVAKCDQLSGERQFQRCIKRAGIVKPQSAEAIKKQAAREAAKAANPAPSKGAKLPTAKPAKSGAATVAAASVMVALTDVENELVRLFRAGEFALLHAKLKSLEPAIL